MQPTEERISDSHMEKLPSHFSMGTSEERPQTLEEKIAALEKEIANCWREYYAAVGNEQMQLGLLAAITARSNNLNSLENKQPAGLILIMIAK
jgi:hypothetical protein